MVLLFHNSYDEYYRFPFGAVPCNESVHIRLKIQTEQCPYGVTMVISTNDRKQNIQMKLDEKNLNEYVYKGEVNASSFPCLMWYYFHIIIDGKSLYYGNSNSMYGGIGEVRYHIPKSYQITVHENNLSTPQWLKESVMYQLLRMTIYRFLTHHIHVL